MDFIVRPGPRLLPMGWFPRMSAVPRDHRHRPAIAHPVGYLYRARRTAGLRRFAMTRLSIN